MATWANEVASLTDDLKESDQFWQTFGVDTEHGGFMCSLAHNGDLLSPAKFVWYQGRGLWVYSRQYRLHGRDPKHLAIAKAAFEFLVNHFRDPEVPHGWCVETGRKGSTEVKRGHDGLDVATTGYGTAFIAEGCIEYCRASGDSTALDLAISELTAFAELVDNPKHNSDTHIPEPFQGARCLGHSMILLSLTSQLLEDPALLAERGSDRDLVIALNDRAVDEVRNKFYSEDIDLVLEVLEHDYSSVNPGPNSRFVYLGHGIETLWMLMREAVRRGDEDLYNWAALKFMRHVDVARDPIHGGVFRGLDVQSHTFLIDADCKVNADDDSGWAARTYKWIRSYMDERFRKPLRDRGLPYVIVGGDREVTFQERYVNAGQMAAPSRKENYHHPRSLMLAAELLSEIAKTV